MVISELSDALKPKLTPGDRDEPTRAVREAQRIGSSAEAFTAQTTCIVDVLSAGIDRAALTEFDVAISPLGRTAAPDGSPGIARGPVDGIAHAARGGCDDLDLIDARSRGRPHGYQTVLLSMTNSRSWPPIEPLN